MLKQFTSSKNEIHSTMTEYSKLGQTQELRALLFYKLVFLVVLTIYSVLALERQQGNVPGCKEHRVFGEWYIGEGTPA